MPSFTTATATTPAATYAAAATDATDATTTSSTHTTTTGPSQAISGCVKWFNNKAGYGFITVTDPTPRDIFVHHSSIQVNQSQYRYLVQGEYVELNISVVENDTHEFQASNVCGVNGGKLMCETRNDMRAERHQASAPVQTQAQTQTPAAPRHARKTYAQARPQLSENDQTEWMIVPKRQTSSRPYVQRADSQTSRPRVNQGSNSSNSSNSNSRRPQQRQPTVELAAQ
jgi:cold shock CspA family protein